MSAVQMHDGSSNRVDESFICCMIYLYFQWEECEEGGMWHQIRLETREAKKNWPLTPECFHCQQMLDIRGEERRGEGKETQETRTHDVGLKMLSRTTRYRKNRTNALKTIFWIKFQHQQKLHPGSSEENPPTPFKDTGDEERGDRPVKPVQLPVQQPVQSPVWFSCQSRVLCLREHSTLRFSP